MQEEKKQFYNIDFLRVFLTLAIVLFHNRIHLSYLHCDLYSVLYNAFNNGRNAVEGFFIISGFFLFLNYKQSTTVVDFIKKKFARLSPVIAFSVLLCAISWSLGVVKFNFFKNILTIFLLNSFGRYWCIGSNVVLWYTSALFFGMVVFFCIKKYVKENLVLPIIITLTIGSIILLQVLNDGNYGGYDIVYYNFLSVSTLRAFAGMGCGIVCTYLYTKFFNKFKLNCLFASILELAAFGFIFWWLFLIHKSINHFYFLLVFLVLFICFLFKQGILSKVVDKPVWTFLGTYTYSVFVIHYIIIRILYTKVWKTHILFVQTHPIIPMIVNLSVVVLMSVISYHFIEKPAAKFLTSYKRK